MEENNEAQKTEERRFIAVQKNALMKVLKDNVQINISFDHVRTYRPEFGELSDSDLHAKLSSMSPEELADIFAGGVYVMTKEIVERIPVVPVAVPVKDGAEEVIEDPVEPKQEEEKETIEEEKPVEEKKQDETKPKNKRKWLALLAVIPLVLLLKNCSQERIVPEEIPPEPPSQVETIVEEEDKEIIDHLGQVPPIVIHNPTDAMQEEKALTDYGNQEHESNVRISGGHTSGDEMYRREVSVVEGFEENQIHMQRMDELMQIVTSPDATPQEKQQALLDMQEHAEALYGAYDMDRITEIRDYAVGESEARRDDITGSETNMADNMLVTYETNRSSQRSNVSSLAYIQYLTDLGYDITAMDVQVQADGDIVISGIQGQRTIMASQKDNKPMSFEDFKRECDEAIGRGEDAAQFTSNQVSQLMMRLEIEEAVKTSSYTNDSAEEEEKDSNKPHMGIHELTEEEKRNEKQPEVGTYDVPEDESGAVKLENNGIAGMISIDAIKEMAAKRGKDPQQVMKTVMGMNSASKGKTSQEIEDGRDV